MVRGELDLTSERKKHFHITVILFWCGLVVVSSLYITIPLLSVFADDFEVTLEQAAWSSSVFSFCYALGFLLFGPLSDRYGRKRMITIGLGILTICTPIIGWCQHWLGFVVVRGMQGFAASTFAPAALAYVVDTYPAEKRVTTIGFVSSGFLMSGIVGQVISSVISHVYGWRFVFYILGVVYLMTFLLILFLIPKGHVQQVSGSVLASFKQFGKIITQKRLLLCYAITMTLLFSFVGMYTALGSYLGGPAFGLDDQEILSIRSAGIVGMLLSPFAGKFVVKFGIYRTLRGGLFLAVIGLASLGLSSQLIFLVIMSVVFVAGISITVPTLISLVGQLGGAARGSAVSLYTFILFMGATLGPMVTIRLLKTGNYFLTFELLALLLAFGWLCSFFFTARTNGMQKS